MIYTSMSDLVRQVLADIANAPAEPDPDDPRPVVETVDPEAVAEKILNRRNGLA